MDSTPSISAKVRGSRSTCRWRPKRLLPTSGSSSRGDVPSGSLTPPRHRNSRSGSRSRSEEHTSELQSRLHLVCRLLLEKKKKEQAQLYGTRYQEYTDTRSMS